MTIHWCRVSDSGLDSFGIVEGSEIALVHGSPFGSYDLSGRRKPLASAKLLVPVLPSNFYAVGVNYADHIAWAKARHKMSIGIPTQPDIGYRSSNALIATGEPIVIPRDSKGPVEYEGELVAVVGRKARCLLEHEALDCILGYTLGNDISERSWQMSDRTLWRAKNADSFKPMGPLIATGLDPHRQRIKVRINGKVVNEYDTDKMIWTLRDYIVRMTQYVTLYPGDVIWLGTDGACEPPLQHGDVVQVLNDHIGVLSNPVVAESQMQV